MVFHQYRAILVHVPKTGGQSIKDLLGREQSNVDAFPGVLSAELGDATTGRKHVHMSAREMAAHDQFGYFRSYFRFAFVRNPFDRAVSEFFWRKSRHPVRIAFDTFEEFAHALRDGWEFDKDDGRHIASQSAMLCDVDGKLMVDFVGRHEQFAADATRLLHHLGLSPGPFPRQNATRHVHYSSYYSPDSRRIVADLYAEDLERYGYRFESAASPVETC